MPNGLKNWKYKDIVLVLKEHNFVLNHTRGSHFYYVGHVGGMYRQVCVPYHASVSIKPRTVNGIILQSGIPKSVWIKK